MNSLLYSYGFNGQERDDEVKGKGNSVNFTYRMHDPRLGRFLGLDPLSSKFPYNSPYAYCENRVIDGRDYEGLEYVSSQVTFRLIAGFVSFSATSGVAFDNEGFVFFVAPGIGFAAGLGGSVNGSMTVHISGKAEDVSGNTISGGFFVGAGVETGVSISINFSDDLKKGDAGLTGEVGAGFGGGVYLEYNRTFATKKVTWESLRKKFGLASKEEVFGLFKKVLIDNLKSTKSTLQGDIKDLNKAIKEGTEKLKNIESNSIEGKMLKSIVQKAKEDLKQAKKDLKSVNQQIKALEGAQLNSTTTSTGKSSKPVPEPK
jgi:RHS repeat-associated protein